MAARAIAVVPAGRVQCAYIVNVLDADLGYDPQEYLRPIDPIQRGMAVPLSPRPQRVLLYWHSVANKMVTGLSDGRVDLSQRLSGERSFDTSC